MFNAESECVLVKIDCEKLKLRLGEEKQRTQTMGDAIYWLNKHGFRPLRDGWRECADRTLLKSDEILEHRESYMMG